MDTPDTLAMIPILFLIASLASVNAANSFSYSDNSSTSTSSNKFPNYRLRKHSGNIISTSFDFEQNMKRLNDSKLKVEELIRRDELERKKLLKQSQAARAYLNRSFEDSDRIRSPLDNFPSGIANNPSYQSTASDLDIRDDRIEPSMPIPSSSLIISDKDDYKIPGYTSYILVFLAILTVTSVAVSIILSR
jgi:hypothetical protein